MKNLRLPLAAFLLVAMGSMAPLRSSQDNPKPIPAPNLSGLHDFDLRVGTWQAHHRRLKERLADNHEWVEFDGTCNFFPLMDGFANVDENVFNMPNGAYRGVSLRAYDPKTGEWAIWWLDGRNPFGELDPPVKGRFVNGVGTFYADDTLRGKPIRVRFTWSQVTRDTAHWEQAFSPDGGKTWEINWTTDFRRILEKRGEGIPAGMDMDKMEQYGIADGIQALQVVRQHDWLEAQGLTASGHRPQ